MLQNLRIRRIFSYKHSIQASILCQLKQFSISNQLNNNKHNDDDVDDKNQNQQQSTTKTPLNSKLLMENRFKKFFDEDSEIIYDDIDLLLNQKQKQSRKFSRKNLEKLKRGIDGVFDLDEMIQFLRQENLKDIVAIKIPKYLKYCDYMIVCTAMSKRHLKTSVETLNKLYKLKKNSNDPFLDLNDRSDDWRLIDLNNLIVHIFMEKTREYYDIETLWAIGPECDDKIYQNSKSTNIIQNILDEHFVQSKSLNEIRP